MTLLGRRVELCVPKHVMHGQRGYISAYVSDRNAEHIEVTFTDDSTVVVERHDVIFVEYLPGEHRECVVNCAAIAFIGLVLGILIGRVLA